MYANVLLSLSFSHVIRANLPHSPIKASSRETHAPCYREDFNGSCVLRMRVLRKIAQFNCGIESEPIRLLQTQFCHQLSVLEIDFSFEEQNNIDGKEDSF